MIHVGERANKMIRESLGCIDVQSIIDFWRKNKVLSIRFSPILPIASGKKEYISLLRAIFYILFRISNAASFGVCKWEN